MILQIRNSSAEPIIRHSRIVQNKSTPKLHAGMYFYGIGSVIRGFLITASANKRFGYPGRACSVIRKFRITVFPLSQVSFSSLKSVPMSKNNTARETLTPTSRINVSLTTHANSSIIFREIITQRRNHAC